MDFYLSYEVVVNCGEISMVQK